MAKNLTDSLPAVTGNYYFFHRFFLRRPAYWTQDLPNPIATKANRAQYGGGRLPKLAVLTCAPSRSGSVDFRVASTRAHARTGTM